MNFLLNFVNQKHHLLVIVLGRLEFLGNQVHFFISTYLNKNIIIINNINSIGNENEIQK